GAGTARACTGAPSAACRGNARSIQCRQGNRGATDQREIRVRAFQQGRFRKRPADPEGAGNFQRPDCRSTSLTIQAQLPTIDLQPARDDLRLKRWNAGSLIVETLKG